MPDLKIDHDKLAYGLEQGMGNTLTIFADLEPERRLRTTACGLASTAIHLYAQQSGIPSRLVISTPRLSFDPEMQHVIPLLGDDQPVAIETTPSQFLMYVGLSIAYEDTTGDSVFPPEKILSFPLHEREVVVSWLTKAALDFQRINKRPRSKWHTQLGKGPLATSSASVIQDAYEQIWNPENFTPWVPPDYVVEDGRIVSRSIPEDAIAAVSTTPECLEC